MLASPPRIPPFLSPPKFLPRVPPSCRMWLCLVPPPETVTAHHTRPPPTPPHAAHPKFASPRGEDKTLSPLPDPLPPTPNPPDPPRNGPNPTANPVPCPPPGCSPRPPRKNSGGRRLYRGPIGPHGAALFLAEVKGSATSARAFFHSHLRLYNLGFLSRFRRFSNLPRFFFIYFFIFYFRRALRVPARVPAPTSVRIRHPQPRCLGKGQEQPPPGIGVPE